MTYSGKNQKRDGGGIGKTVGWREGWKAGRKAGWQAGWQHESARLGVELEDDVGSEIQNGGARDGKRRWWMRKLRRISRG